ncbi:hypothetical protein [Ruminococcus sp.]|nr:hypothetical protein [Ruminococcus sp.]MBQ8966605.1 hypothetical protein [Ruminococcus sp.]
MSVADIILIIIIAAVLTAAVVHTVKKKGSCSCGCCTGGCPHCNKK